MATDARFYQPRNADELKGQLLRDIRLAAIDSGLAEPPTTPGTDWDLLSAAVANMGILAFANLAASEDDTSLLTATGPALEQIRVAEGLPEVPPAPATGKVVVTVSGLTTITNGTAFTNPSGLPGTVVGTYVNPADQSEVNVTMTDAGTGGNLASGIIVRFAPPPINVAEEAKVSLGEPLTGGTDSESDDRKRDRILNARRNRPAGGNWAHMRETGLQALGSVQDCYVMPALGGPSSVKVVPVKDFDLTIGDFSRTLPSSGLAVVRAAIQAQFPTAEEIVVQSSANEQCDMTIKIAIPTSSLSGGNGRGWTDQFVWPNLVGGDSNNIAITSVAAGNATITIDAATTTAPIDGLTHIAWWSSVDRKFYTALVVFHTGATTAWGLTLDRPLVGKNGASPQAGDYISPAAQNLSGYGDAWIEVFRGLGPGENTADPNRGARTLRHPYVGDEDPCAITTTVLSKLSTQFTEITDIQFGYTPLTTPTVPAAVATSPNVLVPRRFGIYKI